MSEGRAQIVDRTRREAIAVVLSRPPEKNRA
jgi:hypothetical protein